MWGLRNLSLSLRVPLLVAALMVLVGVVASQQVLSALDRLQGARIRELARLHVEALSVALGPQVLREDVWEVYDTLERAAGASEGRRTVFSAVADAKGRVLAATDPRRAPVDSAISALSAGAQRPGDLVVNGDQPRVKLRAPLVYQGREVGQIVTELDISDLVRERATARRFLIWANALATGLLALFGYLASRRMLMPIARLLTRMRDTEGAPRPIPEGEIPPGDGEMARLMRSYNDMAGAVEAKAETERRLAERERFVSLGRLSSSLAHEINNPLGGLLNATDTIRNYADRPEVVRRSADLLARGLKHLRDVAKSSLDLHRLERSETPLGSEDFEDLRLLIGPEATRNAQSLEWRVDLDSDFASSLPSAPVRQIALNLLLNATRAAGREGRVGLRAHSDGTGLSLEVSDTGPGLSAGARARLLTPGPVPPGGGVGLRLVRDLVIGLGGTVDTERAGGMTRIVIEMPLMPERAPC